MKEKFWKKSDHTIEIFKKKKGCPTPLPVLAWWVVTPHHVAHNLKLLFLKDYDENFFGFHPFPCHCGSLSLQKSLFVNNLWHEVMSTEESRWILGIDQTLVFKNCLLSSTKHLYIFEHLWPYEAQISGIVGASDSQTICIFANLRDIRGQNHLYICKSPGYLQISYIFRA